jgi:hypothetical protein
MSRRPNLIPSIQLNVALPEDVHTQLTLHLFSELEGRVPLGAYQRFITERIREYFQHRRLDLAPFANCDPGLFEVSAAPASLSALERLLKGEFPA